MAQPIYPGISSFVSWTTTTRPVGSAPILGWNSTLNVFEFIDGQGNYHQLAAQDWVAQQITSVVDAAVPGPVTSLTVSGVSNSTVYLTWGAPVSGGAPTSWPVTQQPVGGTVVNSLGTFGASGGLVTGLASGTSYGFSVYAENAFGTSVAEQVATTTSSSITAPGPVTNLQITSIADVFANLSWGLANTGSPATSWTVTTSPTGGTSTNANASGATVTGLTASTAYTFSVTDSNTGGTSSAATVSGTTTATLVPPGAVTSLASGTVTSSLITLTWVAPTSGGAVAQYAVFATPTAQYIPDSLGELTFGTFGPTGGTITGYTAQYTSNTGFYVPTGTLTPLSPSTEYTILVLSVNAAGATSFPEPNITATTASASGSGQTVTGVGLQPGTVTVGSASGTIVGTLVATTSNGLPLPAPSWTIPGGSSSYAVANGNQIETLTVPATSGVFQLSVSVASSGVVEYTGNVSISVNPASGTGLLQPLTALTYVPWVPNIVVPGAQQMTAYGQAIPTGGIGTIAWLLAGGAEVTGGYITIDSISGAISAQGANLTVNTAYPITITGTDGLGNTASVSVTLNTVPGGFWFEQGNSPRSNFSPFNFYLDNSNEVANLSYQFSYWGVGDSAWTGTTTVTFTDPSGLFYGAGTPAVGNAGGTLGVTSWSPPAGTYPVTWSASNSAGGPTHTITVDIVVGNAGGPTAEILFVPQTVSTAASPGVGAGAFYGHTPFNDASWTLVAGATGMFGVNSTTGGVMVNGALTAGAFSVTAQLETGFSSLPYAQAFNINVVQGTTLPSSDMTVSLTPNLTNAMYSGTIATATVTGVSGVPRWSLSGDGTQNILAEDDIQTYARYIVNTSGTTGTVSIQGYLSASVVLNGIDYSDQISITATDGINYCTKTITLSVQWPSGAPVVHIGPGQQYATFDAFFQVVNQGFSAPAWAPYAGSTVVVHPGTSSSYYQGGLWNTDFASFYAPFKIVGAPGGPRPQIDCRGAGGTWGPPNGKWAFGPNNCDLWIQRLEIFNCLTGGTGSSDDTLAAIGATTGWDGNPYAKGAGGNIWAHDCFFYDNVEHLGKLAAGSKAFITNCCGDRGGQGESGLTHGIYFNNCDFLLLSNTLWTGTQEGHGLKSRSTAQTFLNTRVYDGEMGASAYLINFPEGGPTVFQNVVMQRGANWQNPEIIEYLEPGPPGQTDAYYMTAATHAVTISGSTFIGTYGSTSLQYTPDGFYTWGLPTGTADGLPPRVTMAGNSFFNVAAVDQMLLNNGATGTNTGVTTLSLPPPLNYTLPVTVLTTSAAQGASGTTLTFATPVNAYVDDYVSGTNIPSGAYVVSINQTTGALVLSVSTTAALASGASITFGSPDNSASIPYQYWAPFGNWSGPQITLTRAQQDLRISHTSPAGTTLVTVGWAEGNSGIASPNYVLSNVPGSRWAINASTGAIFTAAALVQGVDVFTITETNTGYSQNLYVVCT